MKSYNKEVSPLKITFILQTFNKVQYLQSIHDSLISQINKFDSNKYELNILIIQDNIIGNKKEKDKDYITNYNKVIEMNKKLSENEITEYYLNDKNLKPCLSISNAIDYVFTRYKSDFFVAMEDDLIISNNFVDYFIYVFENVFDKKNILYAAAESIYFDSRRDVVTDIDKDLNLDLIKLFDLNKFYIKFNFLPSSNFGTNLIGWFAIRDVRRTQNPSGAEEASNSFKELNYETVMPIVPRCKDMGMTDALGYSTLYHGNDIKEIKNTFVLSETASSIMYPFIYNKDTLFTRSALVLNRNYHEVDMLQGSNINIGDILNECILKYLGNYYVNTPNDNYDQKKDDQKKDDQNKDDKNKDDKKKDDQNKDDKNKDDKKKDDTSKDNLSLKTNKNLSMEHAVLLLSNIINNNSLMYKKEYKIGIATHKISSSIIIKKLKRGY